MIKTIRPGLFATVQDEGRWGYQAFGMPVAGAMDRYAYRVANLLAGNRRGAAVLEMTMLGGAFEFERDCFVSACGAEMQPNLDGTEVPIVAQTVCVHGDTPGAVAMIKLIRKRLEEDAVAFGPFGRQS
jgi:allophanate hydrolase subunit 2